MEGELSTYIVKMDMATNMAKGANEALLMLQFKIVNESNHCLHTNVA
jgi:hypothetical protein